MNTRLSSYVFPAVLLASPPLPQSYASPVVFPSDMVPTDAAVRNTHDGTVAVAVTGGRQTNPLWASQVSNADFKHAVEDSLLRYRFFSRVQTSGADYRIEVALKELKQPIRGFVIAVSAKVYWRLTNAKSGKAVWQQTIDRRFTAGGGDIRDAQMLEAANEGAIRENIKTALQEMGQLTF